MILLRAVPEVAGIAGVLLALSPLVATRPLPTWLRRALSLMAFIAEGIQLSYDLWRRTMSTPNPTSLGQQELHALEQDALAPVNQILTVLGANSGNPLKDGAALLTAAAALPATDIQILSDLQGVFIGWAHQRVLGFAQRQGLALPGVVATAAAPAKAA